MKRFLLISFFICCFTAVHACISTGSTRYYIFYTPSDTTAWDVRKYDGMAAEWSKLLGTKVTAQDILGLPGSFSDITKFPDLYKDNTIVRICTDGSHPALLRYLKTLLEVNSELNFSYDSWNYPTRAQIERHNSQLEKMLAVASARCSGRIAPQYRLMKMRIAFALKRYAECEDIWQSAPKTNSVYTELMRNLYAGVLYRTGRKADAFAIYSDMADTKSAAWCSARAGNLETIEDFYRQDCNSAALPWLINEFCANTQETVDAIADKTQWGEWQKTCGFQQIGRSMAERFIALADSAAGNPRVKDSRMWLNAAALVNFYYGNTRNAASYISRACDARGPESSRLCTDYVKLFVDASNLDTPEQLGDFAPEKLRWLLSRKNDRHADMMLTRFVYNVLQPRFLSAGMNRELLFSLASLSRIKRHGSDSQWYYSSYGDSYFQRLDSISVDSVVAWSNYLASGKCGRWSQIHEMMVPQTDFLNDLIGTRYLAQGDWADARNYLEKVPVTFLQSQAIAPYAAQRDFKAIPWTSRREKVDEYNFQGKLTHNAKLEFCDYVRRLELLPDSYDRDIRLAAALYNASHVGKSWYLTSYGYSAYSDAPEAPDKDFTELAAGYLDKARAIAPSQDMITLYALAFVNYRNDLFNYDWNTSRYLINSQSQGYPYYVELDAAVKNRRDKGTYDTLPKEIRTCDILRQFISLN